MELKEKKVTVVGLGISGKAAALLLKKIGALVYVTDSAASDELKESKRELEAKGICVEIGSHSEGFIKGSQLIVLSPGVADNSVIFKYAKKEHIPVITEMELAYSFCKVPIVAVTGTNGKSTTVTLIDLILKASGKNSVLCGNIGEAFCDKVLAIDDRDIVVVEASSFQLKRIKAFKPKVSAILNITQNHFDWHADFKEYMDSKRNIYRNQRSNDFTILNYDDENVRKLAGEPLSKVFLFSRYAEVKGAYYKKGFFLLNIDNEPMTICNIKDVKLIGEHNISNILCAALSSYLVGATPDGIRKALSEFNGLKHRFQQICSIDGIKFIDDSKATTVDACRVALASCQTKKVILIAGGRDKGSDFTQIGDDIKEKLKALILIGEAKDKIAKALEGLVDISYASCMDEAVIMAYQKAKSGDAVLLSPMCASFDMYKDYNERGDIFRNAVDRLLVKR